MDNGSDSDWQTHSVSIASGYWENIQCIVAKCLCNRYPSMRKVLMLLGF